MKIKLMMISLLLSAAILLCGCSGGQEQLTDTVSEEWGDELIDDSGRYVDLYEKGTVSGQLYTNTRYKFKTEFPSGFTLYDYDAFAEKLKEYSKLSEKDFKEQVTDQEGDFVYLFTAISDNENTKTHFEVALMSYNSCQTKLASAYTKKMLEFYNTYNSNDETVEITQSDKIMFGDNEAYRIDGTYSVNGKVVRYMANILFCVNNYFCSATFYSNTETPDKETFDAEIEEVLSATTAVE